MIAPPGGGVAAEGAAGILRRAAGRGLDVEDADFEDVAGLGSAHEYRSRADVDAEAFAGAATEQRAVHRSGAAPLDVLASASTKHALGAGVPGNHPLGVVIGVVGEHLDGHEVAGVDHQLRFEGPA